MDRRGFLRAATIGGAGAVTLASGMTLRLAHADDSKGSAASVDKLGHARKSLVVVFQRGAVDGLSLVPPMGDALYKKLRPNIAIDKPISLENGFGLHPSMAPLMKLWHENALAIVHAVGPADPTRSHFDAQDYVESGTPGVKVTADGFLGRAVDGAPAVASPLRVVALQPTMPRMLRGDSPAIAMASLDELKVQGPSSGAFAKDFEAMYADAVDEAMRGAGGDAFDAIAAIKARKIGSIEPSKGVTYPTSPLGKRLKQIAQLLRADVGVQIAATDCGGWDTHANQGSDEGQLSKRAGDFGSALAAFATDVEAIRDRVCLVTVTEFGRTVRENGTGGTDHGHGSVMLVIGGGGLHARKVHGKWKGLADDALYESRDLPASTDHRDVFAEVLRGHLGVKDLTAVFPSYPPKRVGVFG